jgi:hypothetical protein
MIAAAGKNRTVQIGASIAAQVKGRRVQIGEKVAGVTGAMPDGSRVSPVKLRCFMKTMQ